jgi:hypothetical protein
VAAVYFVGLIDGLSHRLDGEGVASNVGIASAVDLVVNIKPVEFQVDHDPSKCVANRSCGGAGRLTRFRAKACPVVIGGATHRKQHPLALLVEDPD